MIDLEGEMRKKIGLAFIIISVILTVVSCQPKAWWEDYWWPDRFPGKPEEPTDTVPERDVVEEFLRTFNPGQALKDAAEMRRDIWYVDYGTPDALSSSSLNARSAGTEVEGMVYRYVFFNGYQQSSLGLIYNDGYMVFGIDADTVGDGKTVYTISATEGIEVETITGQVVTGLVIEETKASTDSITSIVRNDEGDVVITISGGDFSELPSSATVTSPELGGETISKAEADFTEIQVDPAEGVRDLDIEGILRAVMSGELGDYPEGILVLNTKVLRDEEYVVFNVVLDDYVVNDNAVSGKLKLYLYPSSTFNLNDWTIESYEAESDGYLTVITGGKSGYRISFENVNGPCSVRAVHLSSDTAEFSDYSNLLSSYQGSFTVNGRTISEGSIYGDGTESNPFKIDSGSMLVDFFSNEENFDKYVVLTDDVDLDGLRWPYNHGRYPSFSGHFDGDNYSIKNLLVESDSTTGFMDIQEGGVFENVSFESASINITSGGGNPKYLSIFTENHGTIRNVSVDAESKISAISQYGSAINLYIGGIVGFNGPTGVIENVSNAAEIDFKFNTLKAVGGIAGISAGKIDSAVNKAEIINNETQSQIGGIVGQAVQGSEIVNSINEGNITGKDSAGGIVGIIGNYTSDDSIPSVGGVRISNVINTGDISAAAASGIVGSVKSDLDAPIELSAVTNEGSVTGDDIAGIITNASSFFGPEIIVIGAANTGSLTGGNSIAGIVNNNEKSQFADTIVNITAAYSSGEKSGTALLYNGVVFNNGEVSCESCYYSSASSTEEISGVSHVDDASAWPEAIEAMNDSLNGMAFKFLLGESGLPVLSRI